MIRIGVTGHRSLVEIPRLQAGINLALSQIARLHPGKAWSVVSSLAEGADRLVVQRVLLARPEARLMMPLPLAVSDYILDFSTEESRVEFENLLAQAAEMILPITVPMRSQAYLQAGISIVTRCDVLIALWDGQKAQGQGGAGEIVAIARQKGLPIAWVKCGNRLPGTNEPVSLGEEQGRVIFEGF